MGAFKLRLGGVAGIEREIGSPGIDLDPCVFEKEAADNSARAATSNPARVL